MCSHSTETLDGHSIFIQIAVAAGPVGYGAAAESCFKTRTPIFSYFLSKGVYAGVEVTGQNFVHHFDENALVYHQPKIPASDILDGKVMRPPEAEKLYQALYDAETVIAQGAELEVVKRNENMAGEKYRREP